jgi:hypothetical protein
MYQVKRQNRRKGEDKYHSVSKTDLLEHYILYYIEIIF